MTSGRTSGPFESYFFSCKTSYTQHEYQQLESQASQSAAMMLKVKEIRKCFLDGNQQLLVGLL